MTAPPPGAGQPAPSTLRLGVVSAARILNAHLRGIKFIREAGLADVHVMKEKPMAVSLAIAEGMTTTAARHGVRLMVNWPNNWSPAIQHLKTLGDDGAIRKVWQIHHRVGWDWLIDRERNGGGAAVDFCSYGAALSRWLMGQPSSVSGVSGVGGRYSKEFFTVEDNAVMILAYPKGHTITEGTWTQPAMPVKIPAMIYGDAGAIALMGGNELKIATKGVPGQHSGLPVEGETVTAPELPAHYASAIHYFTWCLLHDEPFTRIVSPEVSRDTQEILEAGLLSMQSGGAVSLPLPAFLG